MGERRSDGSIKYKNSFLTEKQISKLESIGFIWVVRDSEWNKKYLLFLKYLEEHNGDYPDTKERGLGRWVDTQRSVRNCGLKMSDGSYKYGTNVISKEQIDLLDKVGFIWNELVYVWNRSYKLLKEYLDVYGKYPSQNVVYKNVKLGEWVHVQRRIYMNGERAENGCIRYKRDLLTLEQIEKLESIGFIWFVKDGRFSKKEIKSKGESQGIERYLLVKYRQLLELKRDANEIVSMIECNMMSEFRVRK